MKISINTLKLLFLILILSASYSQADKKTIKANPKVVIKTTFGDMEVELFQKRSPATVKNFLSYVKDGFYNKTIFHRVIKGFMIQGGGFDKNLKKLKTKKPIKNESNNMIKNTVGTLAMARTSDINSATSQFFINLTNNSFLNNNNGRHGYSVFGKVTKGMDVIFKIANTKTKIKNGMRDVPAVPVIIKSIKSIKVKK